MNVVGIGVTVYKFDYRSNQLCKFFTARIKINCFVSGIGYHLVPGRAYVLHVGANFFSKRGVTFFVATKGYD